MIFRLFALSLMFLSLSCFARGGRAPAVEDFVGIEVEQEAPTPQGTEVLFNFEQDLKSYTTKPAEAPATSMSSGKTSPTTLFGLVFALGLPLMIWFMIMSHLKKKASMESASNIEVLENYRKQREQKKEEEIRKAS